MTRALPRAHFNSSRLTRFLLENAMLEAAPAAGDVGQKLGDWLNFRQAIALHGLFHPEPTKDTPAAPQASPPRRATPLSPEALARQVLKIRVQLEESIAQSAPAGSGLTRIEMPPAQLDEPIEPKTAFEPYRRFYTAHQRQMETRVQALRAQVRWQLSQSSPALQQLAELDAAFESVLSEREALLLSKVIKLHEKRFAQGLKQHLKTHAEQGPEAAQDAAAQPAAWLMTWRQSMRSALLAELDTRLQPTLGLLEALQHEHLTTA